MFVSYLWLSNKLLQNIVAYIKKYLVWLTSQPVNWVGLLVSGITHVSEITCIQDRYLHWHCWCGINTWPFSLMWLRVSQRVSGEKESVLFWEWIVIPFLSSFGSGFLSCDSSLTLSICTYTLMKCSSRPHIDLCNLDPCYLCLRPLIMTFSLEEVWFLSHQSAAIDVLPCVWVINSMSTYASPLGVLFCFVLISWTLKQLLDLGLCAITGISHMFEKHLA